MNQGFIDFTLAHAKLATISIGTIALGVVEGVASMNPLEVSA